MIRKFNNSELKSVVGGAISFQPIDKNDKNYGHIVLRTDKDKEAWLRYLALGTMKYNSLWGTPRNQWIQNWRDAVYKSTGNFLVGPGQRESYEDFKNYCMEHNAGVSFLN